MNNPLVNKVLMIIAAIALAFFALRFSIYLLNILMPFVIGFIIATLANPVVKRMRQHLRFPRSLASLLAVIIVLTVIGGAMYGIFTLSRGQVANLTAMARDLAESAMGIARATFDKLRDRFPQIIQISFNEFLTSLTPQVESTIGDGTVFLGGWLFGLAKRLPSTAFFLIISLISSYYISLEYDKVLLWIRRTIQRYPAIHRFAIRLRMSALLGLSSWLKAQLIVMFFMSIVASIGFLLIGYDHWFLMGILLAFFDALPIFGSGAILIPLFLYHILFGNLRMAVYHIILYGTITLIRQMIEPRILGNQIGINPLMTLLVLYLGYSLGGIFGMIAGVIALVIIISILSHRTTKSQPSPVMEKK